MWGVVCILACLHFVVCVALLVPCSHVKDWEPRVFTGEGQSPSWDNPNHSNCKLACVTVSAYARGVGNIRTERLKGFGGFCAWFGVEAAYRGSCDSRDER
jgi:hypothetical protein